MEDDIDLDVRLKNQMQLLALLTRAYLQPHTSDPSHSLMSPYHNHPNEQTPHYDVWESPSYQQPIYSPYGDNWDVVKLGHIGTELPEDWKKLDVNTKYLPRSLTAIGAYDPTVPGPRQTKEAPVRYATGSRRRAGAEHPLVHESRNTIGAQAYAVTQHGARRLLYHFGVDTFIHAWDALLRDWYNGAHTAGLPWEEQPRCLTVNPPLVNHYFSKGGGSDIRGVGGGYMRKVGSPCVRHSVRANLARPDGADGLDIQEALDGERLAVQWPDDGPGPW